MPLEYSYIVLNSYMREVEKIKELEYAQTIAKRNGHSSMYILIGLEIRDIENALIPYEIKASQQIDKK